jgi:uncharacterized membrane protein HdeD (DUF308 family)
MIKLLKLQKPLFLIIAGIISFIVARIMYGYNIKNGIYLEMLSGAFFIIGALWFLYPILFSKKNEDGKVKILTDETVEVDGELNYKEKE